MTVGLGRVIMGNGQDPRDFDGWPKANAVLGSILAVGILTMALGGLYSVGRSDQATDFSSVTVRK
jgi:hypothetical protein